MRNDVLVDANDVEAARLLIFFNDDLGIESSRGVRLVAAAERPLRVVSYEEAAAAGRQRAGEVAQT